MRARGYLPLLTCGWIVYFLISSQSWTEGEKTISHLFGLHKRWSFLIFYFQPTFFFLAVGGYSYSNSVMDILLIRNKYHIDLNP
jgi:hypothetical protein